MSYKDLANELIHKYHKNIDFVYNVLGEFLYKTNNFTKKYTETYKTPKGKVTISWSKSNEWSVNLNESLDADFKLSIKD